MSRAFGLCMHDVEMQSSTESSGRVRRGARNFALIEV
jgi:hypothetical protein